MGSTQKLKLPDRIHHLCIEGVIGVGKTTLCHLLSPLFDARLVLENAEQNPFLAKFYENRRNLAFQTQLWFLVSRYKQLSETFVQEDLFSRVAIADYMFLKDRIFAAINLDEDELALYNTITRSLEREVPKPDYVVYLQASTDVLMERIEKRARSFEFNMDRSYVEVLNEAYNHFFFHYSDSPLLIINTDFIDFVESPQDLEEITRHISQAKPGVNFCKPMGSRGLLLE
jgi:deoxyguanosine kinase